jgi:2-dehydropantoate 2-reductase
VIGSTYAIKFIKAGFKVTTLARSNRLKTLKENGLQYNENHSIKCVKVDIIETLEPSDIYDYIFVPVKYEQAESAFLALKDNQSKNIITMINNPKGYSAWENIVGKGKLLPAFPSAGGYIKDGILYSQFGPKALQATMFGALMV